MPEPIDLAYDELREIADQLCYAETSHPHALYTFGPLTQSEDPLECDEQPTWMDVYYLGQAGYVVAWRQGTGTINWPTTVVQSHFVSWAPNLAEWFHQERRNSTVEDGDLVDMWWGLSLAEVKNLLWNWVNHQPPGAGIGTGSNHPMDETIIHHLKILGED
jgi:hypothetical protein